MSRFKHESPLYPTIKKAKLACVLGLSLLTVSSGMLVSAHKGYAAAPQGSVTITQKNNADAQYDAYCLFKATIDDQNQASDVTWNTGVTASTVVTALNTKGTGGVATTENEYDAWLIANNYMQATDTDTVKTAARENAKNALSFISEKISNSTSATVDGGTWVEDGTWAKNFAKWVADNNVGAAGTATQGQAFTADEGYYLFLTKASTLSGSDTATLPIWFPLGGASTAVNEKTAPVTLDKTVEEDSTSTYGEVADAEIGQVVNYKIEVTVPDISGYKTYKGMIEDSLSSGLTYVDDSATVTVTAAGATSGTTVTINPTKTTISTGTKLTWSNDDWKALADGALKNGGKITVTYQAKLNDSAAIGNTGNPNEATFKYFRDPFSEQTGEPDSETPEDTVVLFTFKLDLTKIDPNITDDPKTTEVNERALEGAVFTIKNADGKYYSYDASATPKVSWVDTDDTSATSKTRFTTDASGTIANIKGLDAGTYTLTEVVAPTGYSLPNPATFEVTISRKYGDSADTSDPKKELNLDDDKANSIIELSATVTNAAYATAKSASDLNDTTVGTVGVEIKNTKVDLATTGGIGVGLGGVAVVAGGLVWYVARKRQEAQE